MIEVHFYGQLRRLAEDPRPNAVSLRRLPVEKAPTVAALLEHLGIAPAELGHVFLNRRLLFTCSSMALWLQYPEVRVPAGRAPLETPLGAGDRVALFGQDMSLLVV